MTNLKHFTFLAFLTLIACKPIPDEPIVIDNTPKPVEWEAYQGLQTDNFSMANFFTTPQKLLVFSDNYLTELDTAHRIIRQEKFSEQNITQFNFKVHSNGAFFTYFQKIPWSNKAEKITIRSVQFPQEPFEIDVTKIDTNYRYIGVNMSSSPGILTPDNRLFLPVVYNVNNVNYANAELRFLIFKLQLVGNKVQATLEPTYFPIDLSVQGFPRNHDLSMLELPKLTDVYCYFASRVVYRMHLKTGRYEEVLDIYEPRFAYRNDTLWAFGYKLRGEFSFAFLPPQQSNWTSFTSDTYYQFPSWFSVDKHIIPVFNNSFLALFTPQLDSNKFQIRSLADNNIPIIRDIVSFNNRVYMTTTQGLIFKPSKDFIVFPKAK